MNKSYLNFEYFRGSLNDSELLVEQGTFEIFKLKIRIEEELKLVSSVIDRCVDDGFVLVMLIEGERDAEFLMFGVRNDVGEHGVL